MESRIPMKDDTSMTALRGRHQRPTAVSRGELVLESRFDATLNH
jgi:hypothetical protein